MKLTQNPLLAPEWNKEETKRKRISQEVIATAGGSGLISQTKIAYCDFLKRPYLIKVNNFLITYFHISLEII